ncbi:MAG: hypothetical protein AB1642_12700 [Pseudomonadota bacterium]
MPRMKIARLFLLAGLLAGTAAAQDGMEMRHLVRNDTIVLGANPLTSASRTAFYTARGFPAAAIRPYAEACGFSFGMQNAGASGIRTRLADWHVVGADGRRIAFRPPEAWDIDWGKAGLPPAARIAFRWAQFQSENLFEPGDWIMGMATLEMRPAVPFRLVARYRDEKGNHEIVLDQLACAD